MEIYVRVKTLGKRRDVLAPTSYELPDGIHTLRQLLTAVVEKEVSLYNSKDPQTQLVPLLTRQELEDQSAARKVSFGRISSDRKADSAGAVENAVQCWEDGLVRVFMNDEELLRLDEWMDMPDGAEFTFIRLTFLSGRMW